jgi:hypothetical protein
MAIGPAPNRLCCTAGVANLLGPKRSVIGGLVKSPNRLRWLAHVGNANLLGLKRSVIGGLVKTPNPSRWLAHGEAPNRSGLMSP